MTELRKRPERNKLLKYYSSADDPWIPDHCRNCGVRDDNWENASHLLGWGRRDVVRYLHCLVAAQGEASDAINDASG